MLRTLKAVMVLVFTAAIIAMVSGIQFGDPEIRRFTVVDDQLPSMKLAILADFHIGASSDLKILSVVKRLINERPDLILLLGDFIDEPSLNDSSLRQSLIGGLSALSHPVPAIAVLGNYEHRDSTQIWKGLFANNIIRLLTNVINRIEFNGQLVCIKGLDDWYTKQWSYLPISDDCEGKVMTMTHKPTGLIAPKSDISPAMKKDWLVSGKLESLSFAEHTHWGQVTLPFISAPFVPSVSPKELHCGQYQRGKIGITSVGLGTSLLPLRYG